MNSSWQIDEPDGGRRTAEFPGESISLGRAEDNDLQFLSDASLSRHHLVLEHTEQGWYVRDLNSKNGTRVNGVQVIGRHPVKPGDRVTAGRVSLLLEGGVGEKTPPVSFYGGPGAPAPAGQTILTSLDGVLSGERARGEGESQFGPAAVSALIRAGRELSVHRPLEELFEIILDLSIRAVAAERGVILTFEEGELVPRAFHGEGFRISATVRDRVVGERTSVLIRDVSLDDVLKGRHSLSGENVRGIMAAPLQTEREVIGLVYVDSASLEREFRPDDLNLLTVLANVAAIRIEQERLAAVEQREQIMDRDLKQAEEIQSRLLPSDPPRVPGLGLAGHNAACRTVGGDYYDFLPYGDDRVGVVLGDVAGKGLPAALMMTGLQARVSMLSERPWDLAEMMSGLDRGMAGGCPANRFVSLVLCLLDGRTGEMEFCNAGHNAPILVRSEGEVELLPSGGTVLGIMPELGYEIGTRVLNPGDLLVIYSDGVTESLNPAGEEFGEDRLIELLQALRGETAGEVITRVNAVLADWTDGSPPHDDLTLVAVHKN